MPTLFSPKANWIWLPKPQREKNSYALFRKKISLKRDPKSATIRITADSRYELFVNSTFVGHGPVRAWPNPWPVDEYDITHLLRAGKNKIRIVVMHFGISTFQYIHDKPGLIAQIDINQTHLAATLASRSATIVTDKSWDCTPHNAYAWPVPRITCQQGWEEQFDARIDAAKKKWLPAKLLRKAGKPPHEKFVPRDIPMLTFDAVEPTSVRSIEAVRPCNYSFALNPRELVNDKDKSANHILAPMYLATTIHTTGAQDVELHQPHTRPFIKWKLNGRELSFDDKSLQKTDTGVAHAKLKAGENVLICRLNESEHHYWANLNLWTKKPVAFAPWQAIGPFQGAQTHVFDRVGVLPLKIDPAATKERYAQIWEEGKIPNAPFVRPLTNDMVATTDVYATCVSDRIDPTIKVRVENPEALLTDNADWTTIHPAKPGPSGPGPIDIRLLLDFGKELIGFTEFEIEAEEGTIVDFCHFEFIQRDGRFNLNESMNNSFRYTCRQGVQRYRTFLRRGLKYSWMVLRNLKSPVRIRFVRTLMSTYPQTGTGSFECSDEKLTRIWRTGVHSVRCCSEDTYTDCPTYEQTLWVGDARNEALVDLVSNGDHRLSARCLRLTGESLQRSPIAESQVPSGWQNLLPTWTFLWMRWAQEHYDLTGDKKFAKEMLRFFDKNYAGIKKAINSRGLFEMFAWNLFDWAGMDTPAGGIVTHISCFASQALHQTAKLARDLGDEARAKEWSATACAFAEAVNKYLWSEEKQAYIDCIRADGSLSPIFSQQTQTAAYLSGVAAAAGTDRAKRVGELMHHPPKDFVTAGSPFFMFFLLEAFVHEKRADVLIPTIRDYWGKQTDAGATTFWEMYHEPDDPTPFTNENRLTRSHCHGWSAAPTFFLTQYTLGVRPKEPGYAKILIAPNPGGLKWAQGRVPTPHGPVDCYWKNSEQRFDLSVDAPKNIPLRIELPRKGNVTIIAGEASVEGNVITCSSAPLKLTVQS